MIRDPKMVESARQSSFVFHQTGQCRRRVHRHAAPDHRLKRPGAFGEVRREQGIEADRDAWVRLRPQLGLDDPAQGRDGRVPASSATKSGDVGLTE